MKIVNVPLEWIYTQGNNVRVGIIDTHCDIKHPFIKGNINSYKEMARGRDYGKEHCTHVSGLVVSVAPKCKLDVFQALHITDSGTSEGIAEGINHLTDSGVDIINLSLALAEDYQCVREAIKRAIGNGIIVVGAVSNDGNTYFPAGYKEVLSVNAFGDSQGGDIFTEDTFVSSVPGGSFMPMTGHSMSTGFISGICALAKSYDKNLTKDTLIEYLLR